MNLVGIDVSSYNGIIDWGLAKEEIDFAFIRCGSSYGGIHADALADKNAIECSKNKIPFGFYYFSYARNKDDAIKEAEFACKFAAKYNPQLPICFDFEYVSEESSNLTNSDRCEIAEAFLNRVEEKYGFKAMLYTNKDYLANKGLSKVALTHPVWLALWSDEMPKGNFVFWQKGTKKINGITKEVDYDICLDSEYIFPKSNAMKKYFNENISNDFWEKYLAVVGDIIEGKYGVGDARKNALTSAGYEPEVAQVLVNFFMK